MTESTQGGAAAPETKPDNGGAASDPKAKTPAAEQADSQDKTKDKPDSGQNEDG